MNEQNWTEIHARLMSKAESSKMGPELVFALYAAYEKLNEEARADADRNLYYEILSEDAGIAFDAQAIATHFMLVELLPAIEERVRVLSLLGPLLPVPNCLRLAASWKS